MEPILAQSIIISISLVGFAVWGLLAFFSRRSELGIRDQKRFVTISGIYLLGWLLLTSLIGYAGEFQVTPSTRFPPIALGIGTTLLAGIVLLQRSRLLGTVVRAIPIEWLVGIQVYRVFGLFFLALFTSGGLPAEFALPAGYGDVAVGLAAPVVAYAAYKGFRRSSLAVWSWNSFAATDLVVAVTLGFLSSPGQFHVIALANPNLLVTAYPLVLVPVFAVPLSMLLHIATFKRLTAQTAATFDQLQSGRSVPGGAH